MSNLYRLLLPLGALLLAACASSATVTSPAAAPSAVVWTAAPTSTAVPSQTPAATPTHTPPPTVVPSATPTPPAINPLTGRIVDDPATLDRRPLAIKIAHFPRRVRAHQAGLSLADNVWEHYAEGGVTRFTAIFLSQGGEGIGNVRSARLIDAVLGEAYQAMLVASGSSTGTMERLRKTDFFDRVIAEATGYQGCPILCREEPASATTDKLFTSTSALWALADQLGLNGRQSLPGFVFEAQPSPGGAPATTIHLDFQLNNTVAEWRFDPASGRYLRWIDTANLPELAPHVDTATGQQIAAADVVVLYVPHVSSNIREAEGSHFFSYDILMTGSGPARVFRDGQMYEATWMRAESGLPRFVDAVGGAVPFQPGQIWFEVLAPDSPSQFEGGTYYARFKAPNPFPAATATP